MSIRNCEELGPNLQKICMRLLANNELIKLLYYTNSDPLAQENLDEEEKRRLLHDLICIVPKVGKREDEKCVIAIYVPKAQKISGNKEYKNVSVLIDVFVSLNQWIIKDSNLRPFAILGEIQRSLDGKSINGLGKIEGGDFELTLITDDISCYRQSYSITEYD